MQQQAPERNSPSRYYACDDTQTFCIPATQTYRIHLQRDRDGDGYLARAEAEEFADATANPGRD